VGHRLKEAQTDLAVLDDVQYGLLDADNWVSQISRILHRHIDGFELTAENHDLVKRNVERVLRRLIDEVEKHKQRRVEDGDSWLDRWGDQLEKLVVDVVLDSSEMHERVPEYADAIMEELAKPEAKREIKQIIATTIDDAVGSTFSGTDRSDFDAVIARNACTDVSACREALASRIKDSRRAVARQSVSVIGLVSILFLLVLLGRIDLSIGHIALLILGTLVLLAGGVLTPMIGIEARIAELKLLFLGGPIEFHNQVLYFQSKSVLDVVQVLAETGKPEMVLVAFLVALFSVVFPLMKVVASFLYHRNVYNARDSQMARFFALKSGKWSMADVLVVAMFMAFVGFRGLVSSQLAELSDAGRSADVLTTNGTTLQAGFFLFLAFTVASLVVSTLLERGLPGSDAAAAACSPNDDPFAE